MKVSVPGMPATLLNMSNNDIYKMVAIACNQSIGLKSAK
jgi:hypothetical protein